jgi:hypothetical protein
VLPELGDDDNQLITGFAKFSAFFLGLLEFPLQFSSFFLSPLTICALCNAILGTPLSFGISTSALFGSIVYVRPLPPSKHTHTLSLSLSFFFFFTLSITTNSKVKMRERENEQEYFGLYQSDFLETASPVSPCRGENPSAPFELVLVMTSHCRWENTGW